jgi:hypothetical protein
LNTPQKIALSNDGSLFIADRANQRVRKVDSHGVITTIASAGKTVGMMFDSTIATEHDAGTAGPKNKTVKRRRSPVR